MTLVGQISLHLRRRLDEGAPVRVLSAGPVGNDVMLRAVALLRPDEASRLTVDVIGRVPGRTWRYIAPWVHPIVQRNEQPVAEVLEHHTAGVLDALHLGDHAGTQPFHEALQLTKLARRALRPDGVLVMAQRRLTLLERIERLLWTRVDDFPRDLADIAHLMTMAGLCRTELHGCHEADEPIAMALGRPERRRPAHLIV